MDLIQQLKHRYIHGNIAIKLIYINIAIYILGLLVNLLSHRVDYMQLYFGLSSYGSDFWAKPWSLFTYIFIHGSFMHLVFNMLMLYIVADFYFRYFGEKSFKTFYFVGGVSGGIFFLLFNILFPHFSRLVGASAAIYAVFFAMVAYQPNLQVRLMFTNTTLKLLHLAIALLLLGFLLNTDNLGGNISHLGGALFGYFYMKQFERGNHPLSAVEKWIKSLSFPNLKSLKKQKKSTPKPTANKESFSETPGESNLNIDSILEKISRSGYNSLTQEEKDFLFAQGKK